MQLSTIDPVGANVQIRNVDPAVVERLKARAAEKGITLSEFLRRELDDIVQTLDARKRWEELAIPGFTYTDEELSEAIRADRKWED